ncbi:hypothetical protein KAT80_00270 [Candidatus Pacearchaeota archaeon]|nr:hypothetical protein [Candidatus Pacearchaeota archaeon]
MVIKKEIKKQLINFSQIHGYAYNKYNNTWPDLIWQLRLCCNRQGEKITDAKNISLRFVAQQFFPQQQSEKIIERRFK